MFFFRVGFVCFILFYQFLVREQINVLIFFLDVSFVYGLEFSLVSRFRNFSSFLGFMVVNQEVWDYDLVYMFFDNKKLSFCEFINIIVYVFCFLVGEFRLGIEGFIGKGIILRIESRGRSENFMRLLGSFQRGFIIVFFGYFFKKMYIKLLLFLVVVQDWQKDLDEFSI